MEKLNINQWAAEDRPREKMMQKGAEALSDAELLAILIGSGNTEETAVTLMQRILAACGNDLNRLGKWEVRDFSRFKGMGPAKSITVMASLELGKRRKLQERSGRTAIRSSADIYELFHPLLCDLATEEFWVLLMNHAAKVIDKVRISRGGIDQTTADVRSILREALLQRATQIALIHNHPSGSLTPSKADIAVTDRLRQAGAILGIQVYDHIITGRGQEFYSFMKQNLLRSERPVYAGSMDQIAPDGQMAAEQDAVMEHPIASYGKKENTGLPTSLHSSIPTSRR